jgi:acyl-CoA synthetase (AMP-forming)/AMP-acid ligase II
LGGGLRQGAPGPGSLRYVAVGGAPVSPALLAEARALGLPVAEGYGLSEACSVVALTPPMPARLGHAGAGRASRSAHRGGRDRRVRADGDAGLSASRAGAGRGGPAIWAGSRDGRCTVLGRRDAMILRQSGRNIAPEWVEAEALADPAFPPPRWSRRPDDRLVLVAGPCRCARHGRR